MCTPACARRLSGVHKYIYLLTEHSSTSHRIACHHLSHPGLLFLLTAVTYRYIYTCPRLCVCALFHFISSGRNSFIQAFRLHSTPHRTAPPCKVRTGCDRVYRILQGGVCTPSTHGMAPYRCCAPYLLCPLRHCLHRQFATLSHHQRNQSAPQKLIHRLSQYTVYSE